MVYYLLDTTIYRDDRFVFIVYKYGSNNDKYGSNNDKS